MTPEEQAVRQHLSKDRPYNGGCGCMGAQPIDPTIRSGRYGWDQKYKVKVTDFGNQPIAVMRVIRRHFPDISLQDARREERRHLSDARLRL